MDTTDDGQYFVYSSRNFRNMVESVDWNVKKNGVWHGKKFKIHQKGSTTLAGVATFWERDSDGDAHFYGQWDSPAPSKQQWEKGDEIELQNCKYRLEGTEHKKVD